MKILTNYDFSKNQLMNYTVHNLATAPENPVESQEYYNTADHTKYYHNGTDWVRSDGLGATMTGASIVVSINGSTGIIDLDNLPTAVETAVNNTHTHSNKTVLDATTASFLVAQETKLSHITVTQAVNLDTMETNISTNNAKVTNATHTGEVTGSGALTITANAVTNGKLAKMATMTIKGNNTALTSDPTDLTVAQVRTMLNVADGATSNVGTVTSITPGNGMSTSTAITTNGTIALGTPSTITISTTNAVTTTSHTHALTISKTDLDLGNVTNNAQVKKSASSTNGYIPTWNGTTGDALGTGYAVETNLTGGTNALPRADAVKNYVDSLLGANDAMVFKGTLGTDGTVTKLPTTYSAGWTYKVITTSTYAGHICEIGDMLIAVVDRAGTGNLDTDWTVIQTNIDGAVIGAPSSTNGNFPIFSGATGKLIANSSYSPTSFATAVHSHGTYDRASSVLTDATVFSNIVVVDGIVTNTATRDLTPADIGASPSNHTHPYTSKFSADLGGSTSQLVTHNLNTQDVVITIRNKTTNEQVITDVVFTSVNTLTVKFAVAPSAGQYRITIVG